MTHPFHLLDSLVFVEKNSLLLLNASRDIIILLGISCLSKLMSSFCKAAAPQHGSLEVIEWECCVES